MPSRLEYSTRRVLDIFDETNQKGTFFVLGYCARRYPHIVKEIVSRGHELASHGYAHKIAYYQNRKQFFRDVQRSKLLLEDISGVQVLGYRAPNFSIKDENIWAYEVLKEVGYEYDSSLYPVYHDRYGNPHRSIAPEVRETGNGAISIFPLTIFQLSFLKRSFRIPVAGGAYWRLLPEPLIRAMLSRNLATTNIPVICYLHPWEIDSGQPYFASLSAGKKMRHYYRVGGFERKLKNIMSCFSSVPIRELMIRKDT